MIQRTLFYYSKSHENGREYNSGIARDHIMKEGPSKLAAGKILILA